MTTVHRIPPILVIGATGKTGRRIADRLTARGRAVRGVSRRTEPAFDWDDPTTWEGAVAGACAAYITFAPDLSFPGADERIGAFARVAGAAGVERLVLLSGRGEPGAVRSEDALGAAGVPATVLRASWFDQNFSEHFLLESVLHGKIALPAADVPEPFVDADDIAEVAVAALTEDGHAGQVYELTGPRAITFAEAAAALSVVTGRTIRYVPVTADAFVAGLAGEGVPLDEAGVLAGLFTEVLDGRNVATGDGVRRVLGRPARDFAEFARRAAAAGAWDVRRAS
jgi:uncharacterized protein YbjT (DUF2867 family)